MEFIDYNEMYNVPDDYAWAFVDELDQDEDFYETVEEIITEELF